MPYVAVCTPFPVDVYNSITYKGFPYEDLTLQANLEEFFNKYGKANAVCMRCDETKAFKVNPWFQKAKILTDNQYECRTLALLNLPTSAV
jgi:hypothetical protein